MRTVVRFVTVLGLVATLFGCGTSTPSTDLRSILRGTPEAAAFLAFADALDVDILDAEHLDGAEFVTLFVPDQAMLDAYADFRLGGILGAGEYTIDDLIDYALGGTNPLFTDAARVQVVAHAFVQQISAADLIEIVDETWTVYDENTDSVVQKFPEQTSFLLATGGSFGLSLTADPVNLVEGDIAFDGGIVHVVTVEDPSAINDY